MCGYHYTASYEVVEGVDAALRLRHQPASQPANCISKGNSGVLRKTDSHYRHPWAWGIYIYSIGNCTILSDHKYKKTSISFQPSTEILA